jgi:formate dehydrogenase subunit gamma
MSNKIVAFTKMQIWFHKHIIHFMVILITTGLPIIAPHAFSWLAWLFGMPLSAMVGVQSYGETIALGIHAARVVHWAAGLSLVLTAVPFAVVMLKDRKNWQVWPDAIGKQAIDDGVEQLKNRYIYYKQAEVGKYNTGQKGLVWLTVVGVSSMLFTGMMLILRTYIPEGIIGFARFIHGFFFIVMSIVLIIHIYLGTHPINRAGLKAMFGDGEMDADEIKSKHPLWWKKLQGK